ncbi:MAG: alpha-L-fucosidase [Anaerolineales bacterium]|nr:alpha-L-fucosidase [Anaerolineales bacterium]
MSLFRRTKPATPPASGIHHAHAFVRQSGGIRIDKLAPDGDSIQSAEKGAWAEYGRMDFRGGPDVCMAYAAAEECGRRIEIRIDKPDGRRIGTLAVESAGAADLFRENYAALAAVEGEHDLFLVFPDGALGLDWFVFSKDPGRETPAQRAARMRWWREARFGQFVHWGPYSVLGRGEWVMYQENWPREEYEAQAAARLRPGRFHAADWIRRLSGAGQRYLVITAKHHDGFCMFDTRVRGFEPVHAEGAAQRYDIVDFSPWRRDPMPDLARECRRRGIRFCLYYSILDWHHRSQLPVADGSGLTDMLPGMKDRYISEMKEQLCELVERYDPDLLWFDGDWGGEKWWWTASDGQALYRFLRTLKPSLIINERVKRDSGLGDFRTPEQTIPESALEGDWESCLTMNDHWGYHAEDHHWKTARELIRSLVDIVSKGGNLLLNVGPRADGSLPWETRAGLRSVGRWMHAYGESIHGASAGPFLCVSGHFRCTAKPGRLFAHVFDWPGERILRLPAVRNMIGAVYMMGKPGAPLTFRRAGGGIEIDLPARAPDPWDTVIVLEVDGLPEAVPES